MPVAVVAAIDLIPLSVDVELEKVAEVGVDAADDVDVDVKTRAVSSVVPAFVEAILLIGVVVDAPVEGGAEVKAVHTVSTTVFVPVWVITSTV